jgi:hypothetical protein
MLDAHKVIRDNLLAIGPLYALTAGRIYGGRDEPPPGWKPADGDCLCFKVRGGPGPDYDDALLTVSIQCKYYPGVMKSAAGAEARAWAGYRALYTGLHNLASGTILNAQSEVVGQILEQPETGWLYVLAHFIAMIRQSEE